MNLKFSKPKRLKKQSIKKLNRKTEKEKARKAFKRFVRLRDALKTTGTLRSAVCYTCDRSKPFSEGDAGHFCQGSHDSTYFIEDNCHFQCQQCNRFKHGNLSRYTLAMIRDYGMKRVEELEVLNHETRDYTAEDFHEIYLKYKQKCEELEKCPSSEDW